MWVPGKGYNVRRDAFDPHSRYAMLDVTKLHTVYFAAFLRRRAHRSHSALHAIRALPERPERPLSSPIA
ncbi:hypothetical protein CR51_37970 [Caballeronia megalochromosomata]|nr:hypothetical protein CR51_37970 [Caballeronia megalochromosomata]